jgi:hypothetical protein
VCLNDRIMYGGRLNEATGNLNPSTGCTRNDSYRVYLEGIDGTVPMDAAGLSPSKAV